jgi:hypothetical protein
MINGFLFGFGFLWSIVAFIFTLLFLIKLIPKKSEVRHWRKYLEQVMKEEDYNEVQFVNGLIQNKEDAEKVKIPNGYKLKSKILFKSSGDDEEEMVVEKWIVKL